MLLLSGSAVLRLEPQAEAVALRPGDHLLIPAGVRHRVEATAAGEPTVWLAVHCGEAAAPVWPGESPAARTEPQGNPAP
ncbi:Cupin domain protein [compost metagenome]